MRRSYGRLRRVGGMAVYVVSGTFLKGVRRILRGMCRCFPAVGIVVGVSCFSDAFGRKVSRALEAWSVVAGRQGEADAEVQLKVQGVCLVEVLNSTSVVEMIAYAGFGKDAPLAAEVELDAGRGVKRPLW